MWSPEGVYILPPKGESEDRTTISCHGLDFIAKLTPSQYLLFELNKAILLLYVIELSALRNSCTLLEHY